MQEAEKAKEAITEFNDMVEQTFHLEQKIRELQSKVDSNKVAIIKSMGKRDKVTVKADSVWQFLVTKEADMKLEFHEDMLRKNLPKKTYNRVVDTVVQIKELKPFIAFLKKHNVKEEDFKTFIETVKTANVDEIDKMIDMQELTMEDLQGCYTAEYIEDIKVKKIK